MEDARSNGRDALGGRQRILVAATLFSMFFGAGNLILPPLLGLQAAGETPWAMVGFLISAIGLPVLAIVAVAQAGNLRALANRVHPVFSAFFVALVYLSIGPFLAIPRTSSTSFEMLAPLLPSEMPLASAQLLFSVLFFAIAFALSQHPGQLTRIMGKVSAPALIVLIIAVVGAALAGEATPDQTVVPYTQDAGMQGFLVGYQTMDLLAALNFGLLIAMNVRAMGVTGERLVRREISLAGIAAGSLMLVIYCGLAFTGFAAGGVAAGATNGAEVLVASATAHFGTAGTVVVALIFFIACLNVCTGLISCCSEYFSEAFPRVPYRVWAVAFTVFSCIVSNFGLTAILAFSVPLLNALYPVAIVLVVMGLAYRACDRVRLVWPFTVCFVALTSVAVSLRDAFAASLWLPFDALPLANMGMEWVVPALAGALVGAVLSIALPRFSRAV